MVIAYLVIIAALTLMSRGGGDILVSPCLCLCPYVRGVKCTN